MMNLHLVTAKHNVYVLCEITHKQFNLKCCSDNVWLLLIEMKTPYKVVVFLVFLSYADDRMLVDEAVMK